LLPLKEYFGSQSQFIIESTQANSKSLEKTKWVSYVHVEMRTAVSSKL